MRIRRLIARRLHLFLCTRAACRWIPLPIWFYLRYVSAWLRRSRAERKAIRSLPSLLGE